MLKLIEKYITFFDFSIHKLMMRDKLMRYESKFYGDVIDVGAGDKPYRNIFTHVQNYIGTNTKSHYKKGTQAVDKHTDIWIKDASHITIEDDKMDGVLCFQVLSVVQKPENFFNEIARILKPGGKFLITTDFLYPTWSDADKARYSIQQLRRFASNSGLQITNNESFGGYGSLMFSLLTRRIRSYPQRIKIAKSIFTKIIRMFIFSVYLVLLPIISFTGYLVFLFDKNNVDDFDFTFNLLLMGEKPTD